MPKLGTLKPMDVTDILHRLHFIAVYRDCIYGYETNKVGYAFDPWEETLLQFCKLNYKRCAVKSR